MNSAYKEIFKKPEINYTTVTREELRKKFYDRYYEYYNIFLKVMDGEYKERLAQVCERFEYILDLFLSQREHKIDDFPYLGSYRMLYKIFDSEIGFLNFITESTDKRDHELSGITIREQKDIDNERIIFGVINKSITYNIIRVLALEKEKKGEPFKIPKEVTEYSDRFYRIEDCAINYLTSLMGTDIYTYYFNGKGREFEQRLFVLFKDALNYLPECQDEVNEYYEERKAQNQRVTRNLVLNEMAMGYLRNMESYLDARTNTMVEADFYDFSANCDKLLRGQKLKREIENEDPDNIEEISKSKKGLK